MEKFSGINPEHKPRPGVPETIRCRVQLLSGNFCDDGGVKLYWPLGFPWDDISGVDREVVMHGKPTISYKTWSAQWRGHASFVIAWLQKKTGNNGLWMGWFRRSFCTGNCSLTRSNWATSSSLQGSLQNEHKGNGHGHQDVGRRRSAWDAICTEG